MKIIGPYAGRGLLAAALVVGASCSSSSPTGTASNSPTTTQSSPAAASGGSVQATDARAFSPDSVTIKAGQSVTWGNNGSLPHTVTFDSGPAFSQNLDPGKTVTRAFATAGTFTYHCMIHGPSMHGTVIVT